MGKCVVQELIALLVIPPLDEGDPFSLGWGDGGVHCTGILAS